MARKSTLFTVDVKQENPLITILKHGKIPVVRFGNKGFQNYKQEKYYESREIKGKKPEKGCFVLLGGVQGNYVTGGHWKENLNIGYIEPDEKVYTTYSFGNRKKKTFTYVTAKERFEDAKLSYELFSKVNKNDIYAFEDFDIYAEAIVDSTKIKKVTVLKPDEFQNLIPYTNDNFFKIYDIESIFTCIEKQISQEFWNHIAFPNAVKELTLAYEDENHKFDDLTYYPDFFEKYQKIILKEFEYFSNTGTFLKEKSYYEKLKKAHYEWNEFVRTGFTELKNENYIFDFYYDEKIHWSDRKTSIASSIIGSIFDNDDFYLKVVIFPKNSEHISISYHHKKNELYMCKGKKYRVVDESGPISEKELFQNEYRYFAYNFILVIDKFYSFFSEVYELNYPSWYKKLKAFYETELFLKEYFYSYDDKNFEFNIQTETFSLDYNIVLKDGIVMIPDSEKLYYNLEHLPSEFDTSKLNEILRLLKNLESFFIFFY